MLSKEYMEHYEWLKSVFPNFTLEMYEGKEPAFYNEGINEPIGRYTAWFGSGDITQSGHLVNSDIGLDKLNHLYIVGDYIKLMHIPMDGISHYWYWDNTDGFVNHGKDCMPKYPKDYVENLMKKKREYDGVELWEKTKTIFINAFTEKEGDFYSNIL